MNKDYSQIDQILDKIILGNIGEDKISELFDNENREDILKELKVHETAAAVVQRQAVLLQVSRIHNAFIEKRNGFPAEDSPYAHSISIKRNLRIWWSAAAVLIIVSALTFLYVYTTNSPQRLFANQYLTYSFNVDRSGGQGDAELLVEHYRKAQYAEAVADYKGLSMPSIREKMIAAFSYMELSQFDAATTLFDGVIRSNDLTGEKLYQDEAEYYLALSLLKTNQIHRSYQLFHKIYADEEHTFNRRVNKWFMMRLKWLL